MSMTASVKHSADVGQPSGTAISSASVAVAKPSKSISPETGAVLVAVIVPSVVIAIVLFCFFQIQKHWKMRQAQARAAVTVGAGSKSRNQTESMQLYLQNKAELSTEGRGSEISPSKEGIFELMDRNQYQELPAEELQQSKPSFGVRHELRGEEHAMELDSSPNRQDPYRYSFDVPNFGDLKQSALTLHDLA